MREEVLLEGHECEEKKKQRNELGGEASIVCGFEIPAF